ncbi:hypothetical protein NKDENANG_00699 [Candidatus Entotheonellaceae bacterium PAL068K]
MAVILIGGVAGIVCYYAVVLKSRFGYDDSLDVVVVHGIGATWGPPGHGVICHCWGARTVRRQRGQMGPQIAGVLGTWIILKILDVTMGLRVSDEDEQMGDEQMGLDLASTMRRDT